jgi:hypothetical protein
MNALDTLAGLGRGINAYSPAGHLKKSAMHSAGRAFLTRLAADLGLTLAQRDVRSNLGGMAVSGEVTLHADRIYVQLHEACVGNGGVRVMYRTCAGRTDYCGGTNRYRFAADLARPGMYDALVVELRALCALETV